MVNTFCRLICKQTLILFIKKLECGGLRYNIRIILQDYLMLHFHPQNFGCEARIYVK